MAVRPLDSRLDGRRAVVTGTRSGIGRAWALRLMAEGASVWCVDIRDELAEQTAAAIGEGGGRAQAMHCDVGDESSVAEAVGGPVDTWGALDIVVANAGTAIPRLVHEPSLQGWEMVLRVNPTGVFLTCKHTTPHLLETGVGPS